jgi:hypothetical protein
MQIFSQITKRTSQSDVARTLHYDHTLISLWARGKRKPNDKARILIERTYPELPSSLWDEPPVSDAAALPAPEPPVSDAAALPAPEPPVSDAAALLCIIGWFRQNHSDLLKPVT